MRNRLPLHLISKLIGCALFFLMACQENIFYHSYQPVHPAGWYKSDTLTYPFPTDLALDSSYNFQVGIRHTDSYIYRDLWLAISPIQRDSLAIPQTDTLHIYLADATGSWKGKGIGEIRQYSETIQIPSLKNHSDSIKGYHIIHLMKDHPLKGIQNIGLCIQKKP